jgi:hypothetical protein
VLGCSGRRITLLCGQFCPELWGYLGLIHSVVLGCEVFSRAFQAAHLASELEQEGPLCLVPGDIPRPIR